MSPRILVVYFSRTGHTKQIAERLASTLGADLEAISDQTNRSGLLGYLRSGLEAFSRRVIDIGTSVHDPSSYDLVIVGTPIWNMALSSPVRSYLRRHGQQLRATAFFCTCGGSGAPRVFAQMAQLTRTPALATLAVREGELPRSGDAIAHFVTELQPMLAGPGPSIPAGEQPVAATIEPHAKT